MLIALVAIACAGARPAPARELPPVERVVYREIDGARLVADVHRPAGNGPFAAVLVIHGGGWTGGSPEVMDPIARNLAEAGFVAVNATYRLAPKHRHPAQIDDLREAVRWIRTHVAALAVDPRRIGAFGYSAGGHLASLLAVSGDEEAEGTTPSARIAAAVSGGAPYELAAFPKSPLIRKLIGADFATDPAAWQDASPITHVSRGDPPLFLYHGTWDWIVSYDQVGRMARALEANDVEHEIHSVPFLGHGLVFLWSGASVERGIAFLERTLR